MPSLIEGVETISKESRVDVITTRSAQNLNGDDRMYSIYKITNIINGKVYIGQTRKTIQQRLARHIYDSKRSSLSHLPLYRAFNKYGIENFNIELLEYVSAEEANDKEKYYIKLFNSYNEGYNATLGGDSRSRIQFTDEEIVLDYLETKSCRATAERFGIDKESVSLRVKSFGIELFSLAEQRSQDLTVIFPDGTKKKFLGFSDIADYLIKIKYSPLKTYKKESLRKGIASAFKAQRPYYELIITKD